MDSIADATSFVVLECIGKRGGITTEREIVRRVWGKDDRRTHVETVKVARQAGGGHAHGMILKVVTACEVDVPTIADAYVATEVKCL